MGKLHSITLLVFSRAVDFPRPDELADSDNFRLFPDLGSDVPKDIEGGEMAS